jgi:hypothetical protein
MLRVTFGFMGGRRCEPIGTNGDDSLSMCTECGPGIAGQCKQWMERKSLVMQDQCDSKGKCPVTFDEGLTITGDPPAAPQTSPEKSPEPPSNDPPQQQQSTNPQTPQSPDPDKMSGPRSPARIRTNL